MEHELQVDFVWRSVPAGMLKSKLNEAKFSYHISMNYSQVMAYLFC